jgi:tRNA A37 threonylcarbamoyladenosine synthetase subunit TsaC/SUA5/YrdC
VLSVRAVRTVTLLVCAAGIVGMIVTSIQGHNGAAVTFGLITAVAVVCSIVAKAVAAETEHRLASPSAAATDPDSASSTDALADLVEHQVQAMVDAGADEEQVRQLVGEAVRLGRALSFASGSKVQSRRSPHAGNV